MNILDNIELLILAFEVHFPKQLKFEAFHMAITLSVITIYVNHHPFTWRIYLAVQSEIARITCWFES